MEPTIGAESVIVASGGVAASPGVAAPAPPQSGLLQYGEDAQGKFAIYPLHAGEALYSSVVVRFTGRLHSDDVRAIAGDIAARSGIADVTSIPIGFPVRIPFDLLLPEFLPPNDPRRLEYEVCHGRWTDAGTFESYFEANRILHERDARREALAVRAA